MACATGADSQAAAPNAAMVMALRKRFTSFLPKRTQDLLPAPLGPPTKGASDSTQALKVQQSSRLCHHALPNFLQTIIHE
jgi:hypothetical protein